MISRLISQFLLLALASSCTSTLLQHPIAFEFASDRKEASQNWKQVLPGRVTDLKVAEEGARTLVTVVPDADFGTGMNRPAIIQVSSSGKVLWRHPLKSRVRAQSTSADGKFNVFSDYRDKVTALNDRGQVLWSREGLCEPMVLSKKSKVLCFFADDMHPKVAFEIYEMKDGALVHRHKIKEEILTLAHSKDQNSIVLGLVRGRLIYVDENYTQLWDRRVSGEIVEISVSSRRNGDVLIGVLYIRRINEKGAGQRLALFNGKGEVVANLELARHVDQIRVEPNGESLFLYGNNPKGQHFTRLTTNFGKSDSSIELKEVWQYEDPYYADFTSKVRLVDDRAVVGFENISTDELREPAKKNTTFSHLFCFNKSGKVVSDLPILTEEGAYLYGTGKSSSGARIIVLASDNAKLSGWVID